MTVKNCLWIKLLNHCENMSNQKGRNGKNGRNVQNSRNGKNGSKEMAKASLTVKSQNGRNDLNSQNGLSGHLHKLKLYHKLLKEKRIICSKKYRLRWTLYGFAIAIWCLNMIHYSMSLACHRFGHDEC